MDIAIVLPVYNNVGTLPETLGSIEKLNHKNKIELIISDDASTDGTVEYISKWIGKNRDYFGRCELVINCENQGISGNHKVAFASVCSEYGIYLGGDDIIYNPDLIDELDSALQANPGVRIAKIDVEALYLPEGAKDTIYRWKRRFFRMPARRQFAALALLGNFLYAGPGTVLHVSTLKKIGGFDPRFRTYEDMPLFYNFLANGHPLKLLDIRGMYWVRSSASLSMTGFSGMREKYETDNLLRRGIVVDHLNLLSRRERRLFERDYSSRRAKAFAMITYLPWVRFRFIPSLIRRLARLWKR